MLEVEGPLANGMVFASCDCEIILGVFLENKGFTKTNNGWINMTNGITAILVAINGIFRASFPTITK